MADGAQVDTPWDRAALQALFDARTGELDRRVFTDEAIYRLELERIFARGWNFMCHESQLPNSGDYLITYIGEDQLIVVRDEDGRINALINSCRHRGNALCRAEIGRAKSFVCAYHGWNYGLDGRLIGVPGQSTYYFNDVDKAKLSLAKARVESHLGFYFACLDPEAPSLHDYLGDVGRTGLAMICGYGEVEIVPGVQKNIIDCNWKIAVDNLFDWYHVAYSHGSASTIGFLELNRILHPKNQMVMLGEYGHAIGGPAVPADEQRRVDQLNDLERMAEGRDSAPGDLRPRPGFATETMGPVGVRSHGHPNIFPNLWVTMSGLQFCLRLPRGPNHTELWWYTAIPKGAPEPLRRAMIGQANHVFGPAGLLEQDDGENWSQSSRAAKGVVGKTLGNFITMGLGHGDAKAHAEGGSHIEGWISEHGQRWLYQSYIDWMTAESWAELKANRRPPPVGVV